MFLCFFSEGPRIAGAALGSSSLLGNSARLRREGVVNLVCLECVEGELRDAMNCSFLAIVPFARSLAVGALRAYG
jgi:hypothetical protein